MGGPSLSGASRARTGDLVTASHALSQLSYSPVECVPLCIGYRELLVVSRRSKSETNLPPATHILDRNQIAATGFVTVDRDRVDLGCVVRPPNVAARGVPTGPGRHDDDAAAELAGLALHAQEALLDLEQQVLAPPLGDRTQDVH